jgi:hypothetical protein
LPRLPSDCDPPTSSFQIAEMIGVNLNACPHVFFSCHIVVFPDLNLFYFVVLLSIYQNHSGRANWSYQGDILTSFQISFNKYYTCPFIVLFSTFFTYFCLIRCMAFCDLPLIFQFFTLELCFLLHNETLYVLYMEGELKLPLHIR